ncbi:hypothetical protein NFI96_034426 [Prochilodus magdalenae]|nr:hypothetical protein NFI96_034426 [Prochilodus magdalenae]
MSVLPLNLIKGTRSVLYERLENTEDVEEVENQIDKIKAKCEDGRPLSMRDRRNLQELEAKLQTLRRRGRHLDIAERSCCTKVGSALRPLKSRPLHRGPGKIGSGMLATPRPHQCSDTLQLTPRHRHQRLQWCRTRLSWSDSERQRVIFSDESRFSLGGDAQRIRVWRHRGQHQDERFVEDLVSLHLHPYRTICRNCVRRLKPHGMDYHRAPLGTSTAPYRDVEARHPLRPLTSPALVLVETPNESVCGTVVSTTTVCCHTSRRPGVPPPPPLPHHLQELCEDVQAAWGGLSQDTIRTLYSSMAGAGTPPGALPSPDALGVRGSTFRNMILLGVFFILVALLFTVALFISNLDKALHSAGISTGFIIFGTNLTNPLNELLLALQPVFPLDYVLITVITMYFVFTSMAGIRNMGIWFFWIRLYKIRPQRTRPQALLFLCMILLLIVLHTSYMIYSLAPQYVMYGSQKYQLQEGITTVICRGYECVCVCVCRRFFLPSVSLPGLRSQTNYVTSRTLLAQPNDNLFQVRRAVGGPVRRLVAWGGTGRKEHD